MKGTWLQDMQSLSKEPRSETIVNAACYAPVNFFVPLWNDVTSDNQRLINQYGPLPCDGGGRPGGWCERCNWGKVEINEDLTFEFIELEAS